MIHKKRENRRYIRNKKIQKRLTTLEELGTRGGLIYEKHIKKISENGGGYMSKHGTLMHYSKGSHSALKTRNKNGYGSSERWSRHDKRQLDSFKSKINEIESDFIKEEIIDSEINFDCNRCYYQEKYWDGSFICTHKASKEEIEAFKDYYNCKTVESCEFFKESLITCKDCKASFKECQMCLEKNECPKEY